MKEHTFVSLLKDVINKLENGEILNNGKKLNYSTIKSYKGVYNTMKRYKFCSRKKKKNQSKKISTRKSKQVPQPTN